MKHRVTAPSRSRFCAQAADIPRTLVSADEADPIHSAIIRKEAWTLAPVSAFAPKPRRRLKEGPGPSRPTVPQGVVLDPHDYYSEAPYWWPDPANPAAPYLRKDGQTNPARFIANKNALNAMADAVFTLGPRRTCWTSPLCPARRPRSSRSGSSIRRRA